MKEVFILALVFLIGGCFAQQLEFQQEEYSPSETIIGQIDNIVGEIEAIDIKVYEGRREIFFERGLAKANNTVYYYLIPTKEGNFSLKIENVLYNNSGSISQVTFEKDFEIVKRNNSLKFGIRPGIYEGQNPEFAIINLVSENINVSIGEKQEFLQPYESKKIVIDIGEGFYLYQIGDYKVPINKFSFLDKNISLNNETESFPKCISFEIAPLMGVEINKEKIFPIEINNNCSENFSSLKLSSLEKEIRFSESEFSLEAFKSKELNFSIYATTLGKITLNLTISDNKGAIYSEQLIVYSFENNTELEIISMPNENKPIRTCASEGGIFCKEGESCKTDDNEYYFFDFDAKEMCCLVECVNKNYQPTNWVNIIGALFGIGVISVVIYIVSKRARKLKAPMAEDKFKEAEKKYGRKFVKTEKR
jgi:hypothetical protein